MQHRTLIKLLAAANLLQLVALTVVVAWFGKAYLVDMRNYRDYVINLFKSDYWIGQSFPVIPFQVDGETAHSDFTKTQGGLVLLFDPTSCQPCLRLVLETLQHVYDHIENPDQLPIYALSSMPSAAAQFSRAFKLKYQVGTIQQDDEEKYADFFERTPAIFLIDERQTIIQYHYPLADREQFTQLFFWKLVSTHLPARNVKTASFADSPLKKLEGASLLDIIKGRHILASL